MGAALFITLEREIPGFDPFVNGKALQQAERHLERIAKERGVTPLMDCFSQDPDSAADFFEAGGGVEELEVPDTVWFGATDGLKTVQALHDHVTNHTAGIPNSEAVAEDLREFEAVLRRAADENVRWHLEVDY